MLSKKILVRLTILWAIFVLTPNCILGVLDIAYGSEHLDIDCDEDANIYLGTWLIVGGSVKIFYTLVVTILLFTYFDRQKKSNASYFLYFFTMCGYIYWAFVGTWSILGTLALFQDSDCRDSEEPLWIIMLVTIVYEWLTFLGITIVNIVATKYLLKNV